MQPHKPLFIACCLLVVVGLAAVACTPGYFTIPGATPTPTVTPKKPHNIGVVTKMAGVPWFKIMEEGVKQAAQDLGQNATVSSPKTVDPAQQVALVEELIGKGVEAIAVTPNDPASLEAVFKTARDRGILVLTHEAVDQGGNDYDFELVDNVQFAQANWDALVKCMGSAAGEYAVVIGAPDVSLQTLWANEGLKYAEEKHPGLKLVADPIPYSENQELARKKVAELIQAHPNLKGIIGLGSLGPPGAAQAVRDRGLQDKICVVGTALPSHSAPFIKDGSLDEGLFWNPKDAGYGLVWLARQILDGEKPATGMEIPGLGAITLDGKIVRANAIIRINKDNVDSFGF